MSDSSPVHGVAEISYGKSQKETRLLNLFQSNPLRVLFPNPGKGDLPIAVISSTSGGLVGGDRLDIRVNMAPGTLSMVTAQAAEKVYRSKGPECIINVELDVGENSWLEWLPQETILFNRSRLRRLNKVDVARGGQVLAGEILVFGRVAHGELFKNGLLHDAWEVRRGGRLIWTEAMHLEKEIEYVLKSPAGFDGCRAYATLVHVTEEAERFLSLARSLSKNVEGLKIGSSIVNGLLLVRFLGADPMQLRKSYGKFWAAYRQGVANLPAKLPRFWHV